MGRKNFLAKSYSTGELGKSQNLNDPADNDDRISDHS